MSPLTWPKPFPSVAAPGTALAHKSLRRALYALAAAFRIQHQKQAVPWPGFCPTFGLLPCGLVISVGLGNDLFSSTLLYRGGQQTEPGSWGMAVGQDASVWVASHWLLLFELQQHGLWKG